MTAAPTRYSRLMLTFHWVTAACVLIAYLTSEAETRARTSSQFTHVALGLSVLALTVSRLIARYAGGVPPPLESTDKRLTRWAHIGHHGIYFLLLAVPITGWFTLSRLGLKLELLGFQLPFITVPVEGEPGLIAKIHQIGGNLLLVIAGVHAAIAFWHYCWLRDQTLQRMLPLKRGNYRSRSKI
jgi:cytochrome b561